MTDLKQEYSELKKTGHFWEFYPDLTGEWEIDKDRFRQYRLSEAAYYSSTLNKQSMSDNQNVFPDLSSEPNTLFDRTTCPLCGRYRFECKCNHLKLQQNPDVQKKEENVNHEQVDIVNEPPHYKQGRTEVIDQMLKLFGKEAVINYCEINAFKYRMRAGYKGNIEEDIRKSIWYENKVKELLNEG